MDKFLVSRDLFGRERRYVDMNNSIHIGWIPYNGSGEVSFPKRSIYGSIYNVSDNRISNLYLLDEEQLEWLP